MNAADIDIYKAIANKFRCAQENFLGTASTIFRWGPEEYDPADVTFFDLAILKMKYPIDTHPDVKTIELVPPMAQPPEELLCIGYGRVS